MTYRTLGIVLRRRDVREYDRLYTIYTREHGKIEALARGSKKIGSKLSPHLESFSVIDLLIARGKFWDHVAGVEAVERLPKIGSRFLTGIAASYAFEATDALTKLDSRDWGLWNLLLEYLRTLNNLEEGASVTNLREILRAFVCQLMLRLGVAPELNKCQNCKSESVELPELASSGALCGQCVAAPRREQSVVLSPFELALLKEYHTLPLQSFTLRERRDTRANQSARSVDFLLKTQVGAVLKSEKFFRIA